MCHPSTLLAERGFGGPAALPTNPAAYGQSQAPLDYIHAAQTTLNDNRSKLC